MRSKTPLYIFLLVGLMLISHLDESNAQTRIENLSRSGTLHMLRSLDSLINEYNRLCSFTGGTREEANEFQELFTSESATVFDDINPNILSDSLDQIRETYKPIKQYMDDIRNDFIYYDANILFDDAASAVERIYSYRDKYYLKVSILKIGEGSLKDTSKCKIVKTEALLELWINLKDTISYEMKIDRILKQGPLSVDWNYTLAQYKGRKMETHFNIRPLYSLLYPEGFKEQDPRSSVVIHENEKLDANAMNELGLTSNTRWGSVGINGEVEFRFIWSKEAKNKTKGLSIGLGAGLYNSYFKCDDYFEILSQTDMDDDPYFAINHVQDLKDSWMLVSADLPIKFSSEKWKSYKRGRYFEFGTRLSYFQGFGRGKGSFSRSGYYPDYGILMEDIPEYDLFTDKEIKERYTPNIYPFNIAVELSFGRKTRSQNGRLIFYSGVNIGAYILDFLEPNRNTTLFSPEVKYMGILPLMQNAKMGYIGIDFGLLFADPNEQILKKKKISRTNTYGGAVSKGYRKVPIRDIESRTHVLGKTMEMGSLEKKEQPVLFKTKNKDALDLLDEYISERLKVSDYEKARIKSQSDFLVYYSFVIDQSGRLRNLRLANQENTEFGKAVRDIIKKTEFFWEPAMIEGSAINTKIHSKYQY